MNLCDSRKEVIFAHFSLKEELRCIFFRGSVFQTMITEQHTNGKILEKRISNEGE